MVISPIKLPCTASAANVSKRILNMGYVNRGAQGKLRVSNNGGRIDKLRMENPRMLHLNYETLEYKEK